MLLFFEIHKVVIHPHILLEVLPNASAMTSLFTKLITLQYMETGTKPFFSLSLNMVLNQYSLEDAADLTNTVSWTEVLEPIWPASRYLPGNT